MREGWEVKKLKDVCDKITDGTHQTPKYFDDGVIFLSSKNVTSGKIDWNNIKYIDEAQHIEMHKRVAPRVGDILLAKNGTTGVAALVDRDIVFDIYVSLAHIRSLGEILPEYMLHFINSPLAKKQFNKRLKGIGVPNLHLKEIREVEITFPKSLTEQKQIVEILDKAFAAIDQAKTNIEKNIQNAKELFDSSLESLFEGIVTYEKSSILNEQCELIVDCEHKTAPTQDTGYPSIRTPNIGKGELILENVRRVSEETYTQWSRRATPLPGDLIMAREAPAGNVAIIPENTSVCLGQRTLLIRPKTEIVSPLFLTYYLLTSSVQKRLLSKSTGATVQHVNMKDIRNLKVGKFPDLSLQRNVENKVQLLKQQSEKLGNLYTDRMVAIEELKKSILQKAFAGELSEAGLSGWEDEQDLTAALNQEIL